jgi:hypothetical protein
MFGVKEVPHLPPYRGDREITDAEVAIVKEQRAVLRKIAARHMKVAKLQAEIAELHAQLNRPCDRSIDDLIADAEAALA